MKHPYRELSSIKKEIEIEIKIPLLCRFGKHKFPMNDYCEYHARDLGLVVMPPRPPPNKNGKRKPSYMNINRIFVRFCERCGVMDESDIHRGLHPPRRVWM